MSAKTRNVGTLRRVEYMSAESHKSALDQPPYFAPGGSRNAPGVAAACGDAFARTV